MRLIRPGRGLFLVFGEPFARQVELKSPDYLRRNSSNQFWATTAWGGG